MICSENSSGAGLRGPNLNFHHKVSIKTMADLQLQPRPLPIRHMDVSDAAPIATINAAKKTSLIQESKALALASNRNFPPHLLLASLLEELCYIYVKDKNKAQHLFKILCERFIKLQVMAPLSHLDEISGLRYQRRTMLNKIIRAALKSMEQGPSLLALPDANFSLNLYGPCVKDEDTIEQQTSRYKNEFQELGLLGKGGFGSVFKAKNYLDGCEYAVKKVRFKHKNTDLELKLLREVKALANLQHTNIVGYNAAWMEYDSPYLVGKESPSVESQRSQDSSSDFSDSVQSDNQDSMSIEFCLSDDKSKSDVKGSPNHQLGVFGLAVSAKLFSTVHGQDKVILSDSNYKGSRHTHLNENHESSTETENIYVDGSIQKRLQVFKPSIDDTETSFSKLDVNETVTVVEKLSSVDTDYFQSTFDNQKKDNIVTQFEGDSTISTETYNEASSDAIYINPFMSYPSTKEHHIPWETHDNQHISKCFNSGDGLSVHPKMASTECVFRKESSVILTSVVVDDQINCIHKSQVHGHNPTYLQCTARPESPDRCSNIILPENFTHLCKQAAESHLQCLNPDHTNYDNLLIPSSSYSAVMEMASQKLNINSQIPVSQPHNVLNTSSQLQSLHHGLLPSPPSRLLLLEKQTISSCCNETSSLPTSKPVQESDETLYSMPSSYTKAEDSVQDNKSFSSNFMHSSVLSPDLSVASPRDRQHKPKPGLNVLLPDANNSGETFLKSFNTTSTSAEPGNRQTVLTRTRLQLERKLQKDANKVVESQVHSIIFHNSITLYIQMELCTFTLQEWMHERNSEFQLKSFDDTIMRLDNIRIFLQILQGVDFIHNNGLIHRDLKPRNIFLSGSDLHVKIGDFGLATGDVLKTGWEDIVLSPLSMVSPLVIDNHTTGVGTSAYASPEQLQGSSYDFKSDMYSLGVMLYEMFHVFNTEMERVQEIQKLRGENKCCDTFRKKWPLEADTVEALTNPVACNRPSAQDVLSSQLFLSHEQHVKLLQRKVLQQQKEMDRLQKDLIEKDKIIARLRRDRNDTFLAEEFNLFV